MLSLQTVLRAANVSLDDAVDKGRVFREKGIGILLTVEYTNKDSLDVWDSFALLSRNGPPLKYTYRARVLDFGESSSFKVTRMRYLNETENARVLYSATGVLLVVLAHGEMGVFDKGISGFVGPPLYPRGAAVFPEFGRFDVGFS